MNFIGSRSFKRQKWSESCLILGLQLKYDFSLGNSYTNKMIIKGILLIDPTLWLLFNYNRY